jgi:poly(3-hydroxybutyrate) depolymerase
MRQPPARFHVPARFPVAALIAATFLATGVDASEERREIEIDGVEVDYRLILPDEFDPEKTWPAVLVFGGGPQTMRTISGTFERNFREPAEERGYIVIGPAAPDGQLFFREGARVVPGLLDAIRAEFNVRDDKFHIAGPSNGGIAAFHVAAMFPEYFISVTAFPGYLWQPANHKLDALSGICVFAYIGENDQYPWHDEMRRQVEYISTRGTVARFEVEADQPHRLETLSGRGAARLFENFAIAEGGCKQ